MELSPKQQTIELIKKAKSVLIIGAKDSTGDFLGSGLALVSFLKELGKKAELIHTSQIPEVYSFLPDIEAVKQNYKNDDDKIIRINTDKLPVQSLKWQKKDNSLDIILESEKNLKFEFLEIINGEPKPDLIIVLGTPDVEKIDDTYDQNTEMFFEIPIINIDHHAGNEYYGTVNLVDLTATSVAEIMVALSEALGLKITNPDIATLLLTGIIAETQSFRTQSTTPKSLTVAAQLLAAGARQQEIISNLYKKKPMALLKLWGDMLAKLNLDKNYRFAWTKIGLSDLPDGLNEEDVFDATDELLSNTPDADIILILCETQRGEIAGKIKSNNKEKDVLGIAKKFGGDGIPSNAIFKIKDVTLNEAELKVVKEVHEAFTELGANVNESQVWDVLDKNVTELETPENFQPKKNEVIIQPPIQTTPKETEPAPDENLIDKALESISHEEKIGNFSTLREIIEKKKREYGAPERTEEPEVEIDVFDEENEKPIKELDI